MGSGDEWARPLPSQSCRCFHEEPLTPLGPRPELPATPPLLPPSLSLTWAEIRPGGPFSMLPAVPTGLKVCVCPIARAAPLLTHILCCLFRLRLENTNSKIKMIKNCRRGVTEHGTESESWALGDCTGCTPWSRP